MNGWRHRMGVAAFALAGLVAATASAEPMADEAVELINAVRARMPGCGDDGGSMQRVSLPGTPARPVLSWNPQLAAAAETHARAMVEQHFFAHTDPQGRDVAYRVTATGYPWRSVGENLAAGQRTLEEAVRGWLLSESHCRNLLDERYVEFGLAKVVSPNLKDRYRTYWALVLGRPAAGISTAALDNPALVRR